MHPALSILTPQCIATEAFTNATAAVARLDEIYERNTAFLRDCFGAYANGETISTRVRATYPFVRITTMTHARLDSRLSYGFVAGPGVYETTVTRPDLFRAYLTEQIKLLIENHAVPVEIGELNEPIPIHFAYRRDINIEALLTDAEKLRIQRPVRDVFDTPDLAAMDDAIANGTLQGHLGTPEPLALFRAARVDYSLHRLLHYTGTDPEHFQNFVIFTNYQFYVDAFRHLGHEHMASGRSGAEAFVDEPPLAPGRNAQLRGSCDRLDGRRMGVLVAAGKGGYNDSARRALHPARKSDPRTEAREAAHRRLHTALGHSTRAAHLSESTAWAIYRDRLKRFGSLIGDRRATTACVSVIAI